VAVTSHFRVFVMYMNVALVCVCVNTCPSSKWSYNRSSACSVWLMEFNYTWTVSDNATKADRFYVVLGLLPVSVTFFIYRSYFSIHNYKHVSSTGHTAIPSLTDLRFVRFRTYAVYILRNVHYLRTRVQPKVPGLAACSENCKWYSSLPLGTVVSVFYESV